MIVAIIIINWNTRRQLADCLDTLAEYPPRVACDVWVVDNASTDGSQAMVRERYPWVRLIENHKNLGFARANNQALRRSGDEYFIILNPDTLLLPGAVDELVRFMDRNPQAAGAGPRLLNLDGSLQPSCFPFPSLGRELKRLLHFPGIPQDGSYPMQGWQGEKPRRVDVVQGACLILRRAALEGVGMLDEDYFMYTEEVDLCWRVGNKGWSFYWLPSADVVHLGGQSTSQTAAQMFIHLYASKLLFFRKHRGLAAARVYKAILAVAALFRLALLMPALVVKPADRRRYWSLGGNYLNLLLRLPAL